MRCSKHELIRLIHIQVILKKMMGFGLSLPRLVNSILSYLNYERGSLSCTNAIKIWVFSLQVRS